MDAGQGWEDGLEQPGGLGGVVLLLEGLVQPHVESAGPGQHSSKEWLLLLEVPGLLSGQGEHCRVSSWMSFRHPRSEQLLSTEE